MSDIKIHTVINSRHQVFDRSGQLPFSIVFGLCRRSSEDTDPRSVVMNTAESILDLPYALSHKLLSLREVEGKNGAETEIDVGYLRNESENDACLVMPSPVGRTENWKKSLSIYQYRIDPNSELGSFFEPGKRYAIRGRAGQDLGGQGHAYADSERISQTKDAPPTSNESLKLTGGRADGRASFQPVSSIPWPPAIQTRMRRRERGDDGTGLFLDITVLNESAETIAVKTRGRQRFLVPRGPMEADGEYPGDDSRPRIIDTDTVAPTATIQVVDAATGAVARATNQPGPCGLHGNPDPRPELKFLTTLTPNKPLIRHVDVTKLFTDLPDGKYNLRMEPRGMWWCLGSREDFEAEGEDRVPERAFQTMIPPVVLQCDDVVEVQLENGVAK